MVKYDLKFRPLIPSIRLQPVMQTYNNFNELAAGQQPLTTDMSVFNAASPMSPKTLDKAIKDLNMVLQTLVNVGSSLPTDAAEIAKIKEAYDILNLKVLTPLEEGNLDNQGDTF